MRHLLIKIFILSLLLIPVSSQAYQSYSRGGADIKVSASPENPGPFQQVTISLQSYSIDLDHSRITWAKDGKILTSNNGLKTFVFQTGAIGTRTTISVLISNSSMSTPVEIAIIFDPLEVSLLWQTDTYTPFWYKGKAKTSSEATITVAAITRVFDKNGKQIPAESLVYEWKKDGKFLDNNSGTGKNSLTFKGGKRGAINKVSVKISNIEKSITGEATIDIPIGEPKIVFYEDKPLLGTIYGKALSKESPISGQMILRAEPFFFSDKNFLNYNWNVNSSPIVNDENNPARLLLKVADKNVSSRISLKVYHSDKLLQNVSKNIIISSSNNNTGGIF